MRGDVFLGIFKSDEGGSGGRILAAFERRTGKVYFLDKGLVELRKAGFDRRHVGDPQTEVAARMMRSMSDMQSAAPRIVESLPDWQIAFPALRDTSLPMPIKLPQPRFREPGGPRPDGKRPAKPLRVRSQQQQAMLPQPR